MIRRYGKSHFNPIETLCKTVLDSALRSESVFLKERFRVLGGCDTKGLNLMFAQNFYQTRRHQKLAKSPAVQIRSNHSPAEVRRVSSIPEAISATSDNLAITFKHPVWILCLVDKIQKFLALRFSKITRDVAVEDRLATASVFGLV